jgi:hypothetical protein
MRVKLLQLVSLSQASWIPFPLAATCCGHTSVSKSLTGATHCMLDTAGRYGRHPPEVAKGI